MLGLNCLHNIKHNFKDSFYLICNCGTGMKTTVLFHFPNFSDKRLILMNNVCNIDGNTLELSDSEIP